MFGGGGAGQVRCGGSGGGTTAPLPLTALSLLGGGGGGGDEFDEVVVVEETLFIDPPTGSPMWFFSCSLRALTLFDEFAFNVFVVGVLRGMLGRLVLDTLRVGGGGGRFAGGRGGGATVGRPDEKLNVINFNSIN